MGEGDEVKFARGNLLFKRPGQAAELRPFNPLRIKSVFSHAEVGQTSVSLKRLDLNT